MTTNGRPSIADDPFLGPEAKPNNKVMMIPKRNLHLINTQGQTNSGNI